MIPDIPPQLIAALSDAPFALLLLWMVHLLRRDLQLRQDPPPPRDDLTEFKLEVARTYVRVANAPMGEGVNGAVD